MGIVVFDLNPHPTSLRRRGNLGKGVITKFFLVKRNIYSIHNSRERLARAYNQILKPEDYISITSILYFKIYKVTL